MHQPPSLKGIKMKRIFVVTAVAAVFLGGCGGGGSGNTGNSGNSGNGGNGGNGVLASPDALLPLAGACVPPGGPAVLADLQTFDPGLTYPADSPELVFSRAWNGFREKLGLGRIVQASELDSAARNHLKYIIANDTNNNGKVDMRATDPLTGRSNYHIENINIDKLLFTGVQEENRTFWTGYNSVGSGRIEEEITFANNSADAGAFAFNSLASTIYHRVGLMSQSTRDFGLAVGTDGSQTFVLNFGYRSKGQSNASNYIGVFPADKQIDVGLHAGIESPNPFPTDPPLGKTDFETRTSYPVSVSVKEASCLRVTDFTVTEAGQATPVISRPIITRANNRQLPSHVAFLVGLAPFKTNTTYNVAFAGTVNGALIGKTWSFTTMK
jgi:hypothetical protein